MLDFLYRFLRGKEGYETVKTPREEDTFITLHKNRLKRISLSTLKSWFNTNLSIESKANDSEVVHLDGDESINDTKTFTSSPEVPTPSSNNHAANKEYVDDSIADLVDSSPAALNTLNELAAALNDDANFASTVTTALSNKANLGSNNSFSAQNSFNGRVNINERLFNEYTVVTACAGADRADAQQIDVQQTYLTGTVGLGCKIVYTNGNIWYQIWNWSSSAKKLWLDKTAYDVLRGNTPYAVDTPIVIPANSYVVVNNSNLNSTERYFVFIFKGQNTTDVKTGAYSITIDDDLVLADTSGGAFSFTLPSAADVPINWETIIKDYTNSAGTNAITIARSGSDTIDGATSATISTNGGAKKIRKTEAGKFIII
jgi:hypothetical protein